MSGVRPVHYSLNINVTNTTRLFEGSLTIYIKVIRETRFLIINADPNHLVIDANLVTLNLWSVVISDDDDDDDKSDGSGPELCLRRMWSVAAEQLIILELKQKLKVGQLVRLKFGRFIGVPQNATNDSEGLLMSQSVNAYHWTTVFEMRFARTVFPCFDQPTLKATFRFCIEHASDHLALSNTPLKYHKVRDEDETDSRLFDCFEKTPPIPTYVFSFAVLANFSSIIDRSTQPYIEIYFASGKNPSDFRWQVDVSRRVINYAQHFLHLHYNLTKLALLNVDPLLYWGVENYGLITLKATKMTSSCNQHRKELILIHEIVHQWLGDTVTLGRWDEICLQEGLTAYFEHYIAQKLGFVKKSFAEIIREKIGSTFTDRFKAFAPIRKYTSTNNITLHCFVYPLATFYSISRVYGEQLLNDFLLKLVNWRAYGNAGLHDWAQLMDSAVGGPHTIAPGRFLENWFTTDGYPISYISVDRKEQPMQILIEQKIFSPNNTLENASKFKPLLYEVMLSDQQSQERPIFVDSKYFSITINNTVASQSLTWAILDPNYLTFSRKIYDPLTYLSIMECYWKKLEGLSTCPIRHLHWYHVFVDLSYGFQEKLLLHGPGEDDGGWNASLWRRVLQTAARINQKYPISSSVNVPPCSCCVQSEKPLKTILIIPAGASPNNNTGCELTWNSSCVKADVSGRVMS